ncbi:MAG TPA: galactokinase [Acidobacteriota bacterium]|nr:galactokinase [Acidobacteriota bacterium]
MNVDRLIETFVRIFERKPEIETRAPGRVNLIGEHTDYNDGFVLPADIDRAIWICAATRDDSLIRAHSVDYNQTTVFDSEQVKRDEQAVWSNYIRGVVDEYRKRGHKIRGMDLAVAGNIPIGSGLSSSAALEVAAAETCRVLSEIEIEPTEMALLSQSAERNFAGVQCGIMDQFVSALGKENAALFLDCRDLSYELVPFPGEACIVICDSRKQRRLQTSEYNNRRAECEGAVAILNGVLGNIKALRDVTAQQLEEHKGLLSEVRYRRARHVVSENERVRAAVESLKTNSLDSFGRLMYQSHASLRDDYEVSCQELDILVELAAEQPGTLGARMTGAGFGGCTVNLVHCDAVADFEARVTEQYQARTGLRPLIYACRPTNGVTHRCLG